MQNLRRLPWICPLLVLLSASISGAAELSAGIATADITPPKPYRMSGYFNERVSTGTHDPLQAKALVLKQGETQAAFVFCDLIGLSLDVTDRARQLAAEKTGIPAANILIAATHSHTGPLFDGVLRNYFHARAVARDGKDALEEVDYKAFLIEQLVAAISTAAGEAAPAALSSGITEQLGLSFNRRFHMKDGTVRFNPGKLNPNIVRVAGPIDPDLGMLLVREAGGKKNVAALTVFALHLDTVGGTEFSADYPFYLERTLRQSLGNECLSLFGAGTCGDINHVDVSHDRPQKGHAEAGRIGTTLAETVSRGLEKLQPIDAPSLAVRNVVLQVPLQQYSVLEIAAAEENLQKVGTGTLPFLEQVAACKIMELQYIGKEKLPMEVQVFRLSDDVALVGLPGEVFVDLGLAIKQGSPFKQTFVVELSQDSPGYVPTQKAFAEGSYETVNSVVQPGGGELLVEAALGLLKELAPAQK